MIGIEKELLIFLTAFSSGLFLRGTYRCLECFRDIVKHSFLAVGIEDLFYWIFVEMYLFVQIYHTSSGSVRREKVIIIKRYKSVWEPKTRVSINMKDTRRNSRKRRSRRRTNQHKLSVLVITGVILLMTALVVVGGISLRAKEKSYLAQETELKKQIDEEKARSQEIDDMEAYVGTDEYVEEIAKEKLGLVNENEIILKAK